MGWGVLLRAPWVYPCGARCNGVGICIILVCLGLLWNWPAAAWPVPGCRCCKGCVFAGVKPGGPSVGVPWGSTDLGWWMGYPGTLGRVGGGCTPGTMRPVGGDCTSGNPESVGGDDCWPCPGNNRIKRIFQYYFQKKALVILVNTFTMFNNHQDTTVRKPQEGLIHITTLHVLIHDNVIMLTSQLFLWYVTHGSI